MVLSTSNTRNAHEFVIDDVISKARCDLVYNGELDESVLSPIQSKWKTKMIQAGVISGTIETCSASFNPSPTHTPLQTREPNPLPENAQFLKSDPPMCLMMATKTECDEFYIPQQDGARDLVTQPNSCDFYDVDENEELLNEDDDEEDAIDEDDSNIPHMVMCQFDKVKRCKNKWECKFKAGIMQINGKNVLFSEATGDFNF